MDRNRGEVRRDLNLEEKEAVEKFKEKDREMVITSFCKINLFDLI